MYVMNDEKFYSRIQRKIKVFAYKLIFFFDRRINGAVFFNDLK